MARRWCNRTGARLIVRAQNMGFKNITLGISELCAEEGSAITVEDDHLVASGFLTFVDRGLEAYRRDERVFQVAAHRIGPRVMDTPETFFLPMPMPWGWGTWERAWAHFKWDNNLSDILGKPTQRLCFDQGGAYPASRLLERAADGAFQSYFIYWYLAIFRAGGVALCPRHSLVMNVGLDSGVHGDEAFAASRKELLNGAWLPEHDSPCENLWRFPDRVEVDQVVLNQLRCLLRDRYVASLPRVASGDGSRAKR